MAKITLQAARVSAGFTQEELAEKMEVSRKTLAGWESGKTQIKLAYLVLFCELTGFNRDDIFLPYEYA